MLSAALCIVNANISPVFAPEKCVVLVSEAECINFRKEKTLKLFEFSRLDSSPFAGHLIIVFSVGSMTISIELL